MSVLEVLKFWKNFGSAQVYGGFLLSDNFATIQNPIFLVNVPVRFWVVL
jgi:hypothetical protein